MSSDKLLCVGFNQDSTCCVVGTTSGYRIINFSPFGHNTFNANGGVGIVEMLFCTSLIAIVGGGPSPAFSPRKLKMWDTKRSITICEVDFATAIVQVKLNKKRLLVALERELHLFDLGSMKNIQTMELDASSPGICALSANDKSVLAVPTSRNGTGEVVLYDTMHLQAISIVQAHKTPVAHVAFSQDGSILATASAKGTVIRLFSVPKGEKLCAFRRGTYQAKIHSIAFDKSSRFMVVGSDTGTLHVYKIPDGVKSGERRSSIFDYFVETDRDFARARVDVNDEDDGKRVACALVESPSGRIPNLIAVNAASGDFYRWEISESGECELHRSNNVLNLDVDMLGKRPGKGGKKKDA